MLSRRSAVGSPGPQDRELRLPLGLQAAEWWTSPYDCYSGSLSQLLTEEGTALKKLASPGPTSHSPHLQGLRVLFENPSELLSVGGHSAGPSWTQGCMVSPTRVSHFPSSAKSTALIRHSALSLQSQI